jgi:hypothetical protein
MTYAGRNIVPGLGHAKQYGDVKPVNIIPINPLLIIGSPTTIQI